MVFGLSGMIANCINQSNYCRLAHSIFEGLAIGLQSSSSSLWLVSLIVLVHKSLFALVMGLAALRTFEGMVKPLLVMLTFSVSSPIGIGIGSG